VNPVYDSHYNCDSGGYNCHYDSKLTGYRATHMIMVKLGDITKGGAVIDGAAEAGVNQTFVDYVQFTLKDETRRSVEKTLLQEAASEARSKAQGIATGLGVSLGDVLSASESYNYYPTYSAYKSVDMEYAGSAVPMTDLSEGEIEVSATVSTSFEIG
ncbi:MAG: SIMPL domain-containing protein, partial [Candidatus Micrarchaeota archaeon]